MNINSQIMNKYSYSKESVDRKSSRQRALLTLIRSESIATQGALVERLRDQGISCTQVSVSRDLRELGLVKKGGFYMLSDEEPSLTSEEISGLTDNIAAFIRDISVVGDNLVVVKTLSGTAHSVGLLLDNLSAPDIAGTVAGDDTVFIAVHGGRAGCEAMEKRLKEMSGKGR
jgi:transcriptional regulator of arginine metabolism